MIQEPDDDPEKEVCPVCHGAMEHMKYHGPCHWCKGWGWVYEEKPVTMHDLMDFLFSRAVLPWTMVGVTVIVGSIVAFLFWLDKWMTEHGL